MAVRCRLLDEGDIEKTIRRLSPPGMWNGMDYLPCVLHYWFDLHRRNKMLLVGAFLEPPGDIVGMCGGQLVDPGQQTIMIKGLRTHPDFQGRGVGKALVDFIQSIVSQRQFGPNVKRYRATVESNNTASFHVLSKLGLAPQFVLCSVTQVVPLSQAELAFSRVTAEASPTVMGQIHPCTAEAVHALITTNKAIVNGPGMFPVYHIIDDWKSEIVSLERLRELEDHDKTVFLTSETSLSTGYLCRKVAGSLWYTTVYSSDLATIQAHITLQLELARKHCGAFFGVFLSQTGMQALLGSHQEILAQTKIHNIMLLESEAVLGG
ncbi:hypothetical protein Pelo_1989 [Pelomyxa schiedti]|nr:hypothetical protein Pelo_1989 [Pelomyxa schiedti]